MTPIFVARISTMIAALFRAYVPSGRFVVSSDCDRCGLKLGVHVEVGTLASTCAIDCTPPSLLPFKLVAALTPDGKLSISCACSLSDATALPIPSGSSDGISSIPKSSDDEPPATPRDYRRLAHDEGAICSRCRDMRAAFEHHLARSVNVRPKYQFLCALCTREILSTGEVV